jgi:hypothetical protein
LLAFASFDFDDENMRLDKGDIKRTVLLKNSFLFARS